MEPREVRLGFWLSLFISAKVVYKILSRLRWEVWALSATYIIAQRIAWHNLYIKFLPRDGHREAWWTSLLLSQAAGIAATLIAFLLGMLYKAVVVDFLLPGFFEEFEEEALPYQKRELERVDETLLIDSRESWRDKLK